MKNSTALSLLAALILPASLSADTVNLSGNTTGAPAFNRPTETGGRSLLGSAVPFNSYQFNVSTSGQFTFTLTAVDPASYDTFLHLFVDSFNPSNLYDTNDQAINFVAGNEDANPNTTNSGLTNVSLIAGRTYYFVLDGSFNSDAGAYGASVSGPGAITVVPEPSPLAFFSLGGFAFIFVARLRRAARI